MASRRKSGQLTSLRVTPAGYEPLTPYDQEIHDSYRVGAVVEADLHQHKSNEQLKLYWGFLKFVVDATGKWGNARALSNALLVEGGYVESFTSLRGGGFHAHPLSIAEMEDADFQNYLKNAFATIYEEFEIDVDDYKRIQRDRALMRKRNFGR